MHEARFGLGPVACGFYESLYESEQSFGKFGNDGNDDVEEQ